MTHQADDTGQNDARYDETYFKEVYGVDGPRRFDMHWWSIRWYASMVHRCLRQTAGTRVLELGCGHGFMLARLEQNFETWGLDISEYAIEQAGRFAPRSRCSVANIEDGVPKDVPENYFDVVVAKYVFEHLHEPLNALRRAAKLLRPGGTLFFSVPHTDSIGARWKGDEWYALQDPTHCSLLPRETWLELVAEADLKLYKESADGYWDLPYLTWLPKWLQYPLFLGPTAVSCLAGQALLPPRMGENLLIFARKPAQV